MDTTTNETGASFTNTVRSLGPVRLAIMGAVVLGLVLFFVFISARVAAPNMTLLYADLSGESSAAVVTKLGEQNIPYDVSPEGSSIMVPEKDVNRARMMLAQAGLPNGGTMGYEIFDKESGFGTTNFVQNIKQVRALEGELARTISSLEPVKNARVHLVLPQRELFSRDSRPASASIFLDVKPGARLSNEQIAGIQSLIASAVPSLKINNVSIIDSKGNLLAKGGEEGESLMTMKTEELRRNTELRLTETIEALVGRTVGFDKVRANVSVDLNFDRITTNEEIFDPNQQVVRSTQTVEESNSERESNADYVSVENNVPPPAAAGGLQENTPPTAEGNRIEETTNYEIGKTIRSQVREVGEIKRLSVAVLVDGTYTTDAEGVKTYTPRPQPALDQLTTLVKSAVGFDVKRGDTIEIVNMQFAEVEVPEESTETLLGFNKSDLLDAVELITIAVMMILVVLLVIQPMINRLLENEGRQSRQPADAEQSYDMLPGVEGKQALPSPNYAGALPGPSGGGGSAEDSAMIDMHRVEGQVKASTLRKVEEIVTAYPTETVSVIRNWMTSKD
ncbi:MAG: flagellar basal-body MS-ring/collar protein FliF [Pseudomonadota bacterium]